MPTRAIPCCPTGTALPGGSTRRAPFVSRSPQPACYRDPQLAPQARAFSGPPRPGRHLAPDLARGTRPGTRPAISPKPAHPPAASSAEQEPPPRLRPLAGCHVTLRGKPGTAQLEGGVRRPEGRAARPKRGATRLPRARTSGGRHLPTAQASAVPGRRWPGTGAPGRLGRGAGSPRT